MLNMVYVSKLTSTYFKASLFLIRLWERDMFAWLFHDTVVFNKTVDKEAVQTEQCINSIYTRLLQAMPPFCLVSYMGHVSFNL